MGFLSYEYQGKSMLKVPFVDTRPLNFQRGDCGNFAVALGRVLGSNRYVASDAQNFNFGDASHVALLYRGHLIDSNGVITRKQLRDMALESEREDKKYFPNDPTHVVVREVSENNIAEILDDGRIDYIEKLLRSGKLHVKGII